MEVRRFFPNRRRVVIAPVDLKAGGKITDDFNANTLLRSDIIVREIFKRREALVLVENSDILRNGPIQIHALPASKILPVARNLKILIKKPETEITIQFHVAQIGTGKIIVRDKDISGASAYRGAELDVLEGVLFK